MLTLAMIAGGLLVYGLKAAVAAAPSSPIDVALDSLDGPVRHEHDSNRALLKNGGCDGGSWLETGRNQWRKLRLLPFDFCLLSEPESGTSLSA